jgi:hypothetical protein
MDALAESEITGLIESGGCGFTSRWITRESSVSVRELKCRVKQQSRCGEAKTPGFVTELAQRKGTMRVAWTVCNIHRSSRA